VSIYISGGPQRVKKKFGTYIVEDNAFHKKKGKKPGWNSVSLGEKGDPAGRSYFFANE